MYENLFYFSKTTRRKRGYTWKLEQTPGKEEDEEDENDKEEAYDDYLFPPIPPSFPPFFPPPTTYRSLATSG